ncbi:MAG: hypothetical protein RR359_01460 [Bacilli bacterium]
MTTEDKKTFWITVFIFLLAILILGAMTYQSNYYMDFIMLVSAVFYFIKFLAVSKRQ